MGIRDGFEASLVLMSVVNVSWCACGTECRRLQSRSASDWGMGGDGGCTDERFHIFQMPSGCDLFSFHEVTVDLCQRQFAV